MKNVARKIRGRTQNLPLDNFVIKKISSLFFFCHYTNSHKLSLKFFRLARVHVGFCKIFSTSNETEVPRGSFGREVGSRAWEKEMEKDFGREAVPYTYREKRSW